MYWPKRTPCLRRLGAAVLVERLDVVGDLGARQHAERLDEPEGDAARHAGQRLVVARARSAAGTARRSCGRSSGRAGGLTFSAICGSASSSTKGCTCGLSASAPAHELADRVLAPHQPALLGHVDLGVGGVVELVGAQATAPGRARRCRRRAACGPGRRRRTGRAGSGSLRAGRRTGRRSRPRRFRSPWPPGSPSASTGASAREVRRSTNRWVSCTCSASDSRSSTARVSSRQWSASSTQAPALRHVGPCADIRQPLRQRVDVAVGSIDARDLPRQPVGRDAAAAVQEAEEPDAEARVLGRASPCGSRGSGRRPRAAARRGRRAAGRATSGISAELLQRREVVGLAGALQVRAGPARASRLAISASGLREVERGVAPLQPAPAARKRWLSIASTTSGSSGDGLAGHAEGAVGGVAPGPAGDLRELVRRRGAGAGGRRT